MSRPSAEQDQYEDRRGQRDISLSLDAFTWEAIDEECARLGISVEELIRHAALYFMADADSGRIARDISRSPVYEPKERTRMSGGLSH